MKSDRLTDLFEAWSQSCLTPSEASELSALLRGDAKARAVFQERTAFHGLLHLAIDEVILERGTAPEIASRFPFRSRVLGLAAALLVVGLTGLSLGWLLASPAETIRVRSIDIRDGQFELLRGTTPAGFPKAPFTWGGDPSEVSLVDAAHRQSLRFIEAAGEPNVPNSPQHSCDIFQIIDLRFLQPEILNGGETFIELKASFLDKRTKEGEPIRFMCKVYAFEGEPSNLAAFWPPSADQIMGSGAKFLISKALENQGWRTLSARCVMPSNAGFLVVQIGAGRPLAHGSAAPSLGEQFVDDISLTLHTRQTQHNLTSRK